MNIVIAGFIIGISLIVAIGPQNALIIKQGIKREAIGVVIAICLVSEVFLTVGGIAGVGVLVERAPLALEILKWCGVVYLAWFSYRCFKDAFSHEEKAITIENGEIHDSGTPVMESSSYVTPQQSTSSSGRTHVLERPRLHPKTHTPHQKPTWVKPALAALAFTWLNPGAYIDCVIMLGGMANQYGSTGKWLFCAGTLLASTVWFTALGFSSVKFSSVLSRPQVWRVINFAIGCLMLVMIARLLMH